MTGRGILWLGAGLTVLGAAFDLPALYVPGAGLVLVAIVLWCWVRLAAATTRLRHTPGPRTVVEGEAYPAGVRVSGSRLPGPGGELAAPALARPLALGMRVPELISFEARFPRRGRHSLGGAMLTFRDPLGLWSAEVQGSGEAVVLVLPRTSPVSAPPAAGSATEDAQAEGVGGGVGAAGIDAGTVEFEPDGLRPYREGTPASRIHWPAVARTGELLEHKLVSGGRTSPLLVLDAGSPAGEEELDAAVRATASLALHLAGTGGCGVLLPGESRPVELDPALRLWPELHARLALVELAAPPPLLRRPPRGERVYWITAHAGPQRDGRGRKAGFRVSPHPLPGLHTEFVVSGCHAQRLQPARGPRGRTRATVAP